MTRANPPAIEPTSGMRFGTILALVTFVHVLVIVLLLSHFGWLGGSESETDSNTGQSGIIIPVTLEKSEEAEAETETKPEVQPEAKADQKPEPNPQPEPEPEPEPKPELTPVTGPEPREEPPPPIDTSAEKGSPSDNKGESESEIAIESDQESTQAAPANPPTEAIKPIKPVNPVKPEQPVAPTSQTTPRPLAEPMSPSNATTSSATNSSSNPAPGPAQTSANLDSPPLTPAQVDPNYLHRPDPVYPALSKRLREEGTVVLRVSLDAQGAVRDIQIESSSQFQRLDQAALEAVRQWRFIPATRGQVAVPSTVLVPIAFKHQ